MKRYTKMYAIVGLTYYVTVHCVAKNISDIIDCNLKKDYRISTTYGTNIPDTISPYIWIIIDYLTLPNVF